MSCTIYTMSCNSTIHASCLLAFMVYKYSELQVCYAIKKLNYKASCKTFFFLIMSIRVLVVQPSGDITICVDP
jgi:hypothetical protein